MDLLTLAKRSQDLSHRPNLFIHDRTGVEDRLGQIVQRVQSSKPVSNRYGGKDFPIDVDDYYQFLAALQTLSWIFRDMGASVHYMTRNGLTYDQRELVTHGQLFDQQNSKVVALVVSFGKDFYRINRGDKTLRVRRFDTFSRAIAPVRDGLTAGTKPFGKGTVRELVKIMNRQSRLSPEKDSLIKWGRLIASKANSKPYGTSTLLNRIRAEFRKTGGRL